MKWTATIVLCLLPLAGCSGWVVVISPTGIGCSTNVAVIQSPTRPPQPRTITNAASINTACVVADEFNAVAVQGSGRPGGPAEGGGPSEPGANDPHELTTSVENTLK